MGQKNKGGFASANRKTKFTKVTLYPGIKGAPRRTIYVRRLQEGCYLATSVNIPGLVAQGRTVAEALKSAYSVARWLLEPRRERGEQ